MNCLLICLLLGLQVLYVLQLEKDVQTDSARVCAVSEFLLPNPILSFGIVDAGIRSVKSHHDVTSDLETDLMDNNDEDNDDAGVIHALIRCYYYCYYESLRKVSHFIFLCSIGEEDDEEKSLKVVVRMYVVHPKSLRGCIISFDPPEEAKKTMSIFSEDTLGMMLFHLKSCVWNFVIYFP